MPLPNFIIVGSAKCGTTSLYNYLKQHPQVFMPLLKEPGFFTGAWPHLVNSEKEYRELFDGAQGKIAIGEASPMYIEDQSVPQKMIDFLGPDTRIIIILRNPIDRAFSLWGHLHYHSMVEPLSFEDALSVERERSESEELKNQDIYYPGIFMYYRGGLYTEKVRRFLDTFGEKNVYVIIFEEFMQDLRNSIKDLYKFLGVDTSFEPILEQHNIANVPRLKQLQKQLSNPPKIIRVIYSISPRFIKTLIYSVGKTIYWTNQKKRTKDNLDPKIQACLSNKFRNDVVDLEHLLHRELRTYWDIY